MVPQPMALSRALLVALLTATSLFAVPPTSQWQSTGGGNWFTNTNWQGNAVPSNAAASIATSGSPGSAVVTTNGAASNVNVTSLGVASSNTQVVFDFASSTNKVNLGNGTSAWTAGNVEVRNAAGIFGAGTANTTLAISPGVELLFSTDALSRNLDSLSITNGGSIHATTGVLSITASALSNSAGGLVNADGAEIDLTSSSTLANLGTLRATGAAGILNIGTTVTTADLGSVEIVNGGHVYLTGAINNGNGATLNAPTGGSFELQGGTISGGTVADGAVTFTSSGGALSGATLAGNLTLPAGSVVHLAQNAGFSGTAATLNENANLFWEQTGTLDGKAVTFSPGAALNVVGGSALTLGPSTSASGQIDIETPSNDGSSVTNRGTITQTNGAGVMRGALNNAGNITAASATSLAIGSPATGNVTNNASGTITADGATVNLESDIVNQGQMNARNGGQLSFQGTGTSVNTGTILASNNSTLQLGTYSGGNVTNDLTGTITADGASVSLQGGFVNKGQLVSTNGASITQYSGSWLNSGNVTTSASGSLTIGTGAGGNATNDTSGTIIADNATVNLQGDVNNKGKLVAQNGGTLAFNGSTMTPTLTSHLGSVVIDATGGHAQLNGNVTNDGGLNAPSGGSYELNGGTIIGGAVGAGALTYTTNGGTLSGVQLNDDLTLPVNSTVTLTNGAAVTGANVTLNDNTRLVWQQTAALNGPALRFAGAGSLQVTGNNTLTIGSQSVASGQIDLETPYGDGSSITNQGTIANNSGHGVVNGIGSNAGNITASNNSSLSLGTNSGGNVTNESSGTITANGASVDIQDNMVNNGHLFASNAGTVRLLGPGSSLNAGNITAAAAGTVFLGNYQSGNVTNGATGTITADGGAVYFQGDFVNHGQVVATNGGNLGQYTGSWLNAGNITATNGGSLTLGAYATSTGTNDTNAVITADNGTVYLQNDVVNKGTVLAKNGGTVQYQGSDSSPTLASHIGNVSVDTTGGHIQLAGNVSLDTTLAAPKGGAFELAGGIVNGGSTAAGALTFTAQGGTLSGVTVGDDLTLPANTAVTLTNNTTFTGNLALNSNAYLQLNQSSTLDHKTITMGQNSFVQVSGGHQLTIGPAATASGQIALSTDGTAGAGVVNQGKIANTSGNGYFYGNALSNSGTISAVAGTSLYVVTAATNGLLNDVGGTLLADDSSSVSVFGNLQNKGAITAQNGGQLWLQATTSTTATTLTNNPGATITATGSNAQGASSYITLYGPIQNSGILAASNGGVIALQNSSSLPQTTGQLGTVVINSGGHVLLESTLDNSNATLAQPGTGSFELVGGTILKGTAAPNALSFTNVGGTLNGVTVMGDVSLSAYSKVHWAGGTNLGTANAVLSLNNNASLYLEQSTTLTGNAVNLAPSSMIRFGAPTSTDGSTSNNTTTLTVDPTTTVSGAVNIADTVGGGHTALLNQGVITHTGGDGYLTAETLTNSGTINVASGTLHLGGTLSSAATVANQAGATIKLNGGNLSLQVPSGNPLINNGTIAVQQGVFTTGNSLINGATGRITGNGIFNGDLAVSGGTLAPGNRGIGALTFTAGALTVTGPATFEVDLGGTSSDQLIFNSPGKNVDIGSGLLALSVNLLSAPTANTTFNLISISGGAYGITGSFVGLPSSGNTLTANFNGTPFTFAVNYQPNLVALSYTPVVVPEPSEYALMLAGVVVLGGAYWRRRRRA